MYRHTYNVSNLARSGVVLNGCSCHLHHRGSWLAVAAGCADAGRDVQQHEDCDGAFLQDGARRRGPAAAAAAALP
eukprot:SAG31_NODE_953_length_10799_cov_4.245657_3_plen_75_part_00